MGSVVHAGAAGKMGAVLCSIGGSLHDDLLQALAGALGDLSSKAQQRWPFKQRRTKGYIIQARRAASSKLCHGGFLIEADECD
eukprot:1160247-Pelagomonas_calceolata.AAC.9